MDVTKNDASPAINHCDLSICAGAIRAARLRLRGGAAARLADRKSA
jgi:hypothetical protein